MIKENHDHNKTEILHAWNKFCEKYKDSNCVPYVLLYERLTSIVNDDSKVGTKELIDDSKLSSSQMSRSETIEMTGPEPQDIKRSETADMKDLNVESSIECIYISSSESMDDTIQNESGEEDLDEIIKEKHQSSTPDCVLATEARGRSRITITRKQSKWEKLKAKKDQILRNLKGSLESTPKIKKEGKKSNRTRSAIEKERRREKSKDPEFKEKERLRKALSRQNNPNLKIADKERKASSRSNSSQREIEQASNTKEHQIRREDPKYRDKEREEDSQSRQLKRQDTEYKDQEQARNTEERRIRREDPEYRDQERIIDRESHQISRNNVENLIEKFEYAIKEGPVTTCICCGGLFFKRTLREVNLTEMKRTMNGYLYNRITWADGRTCENKKSWFCITCFRYTRENKIPKIALSKGFRFMIIPDALLALNDLTQHSQDKKRCYLIETMLYQIRKFSPKKR